ncbi:MAG: RluA family pseudouridine synthase [Pirellula sp.]
MSTIVNIAAYKYVALDALEERRAALKRLTSELQLKGTILLSSEGINLFLAGARQSIDTFLVSLRASSSALEDLKVKESLTDYQPFRRLLVKLKREIVPVGHEGRLEIETEQGKRQVEPIVDASPKLPPLELKRWLDEGREIALLDTRNDYETDLGTFEGAIDLRLKNFRQFPEAAAALPDEVKKNPVVMFCTGGIRCEKIGPYMKGLGFENIYQLEGGILKYFEECQQSHYQGDCFVFDQRVAVNPTLAPSETYECFACRHALTPQDTESPYYVVNESCPYCFQETEIKRQARQSRVSEIAKEQRGCSPYENRRWVSIPQQQAGRPILDALWEAFPGYGLETWRRDIAHGLVQSPKHAFAPVDSNWVVGEGERFLHIMPDYVEQPVSDQVEIIHEDRALVIVNKGAPLPVHPSGRFNKNTLLSILLEAYAPEKLRPCHRLDMNTTGLVVFARQQKYAIQLQKQFTSGTVSKTYMVEVEGIPNWTEYVCEFPIENETLANGGRRIGANGQPTKTIFHVVGDKNGNALLEATLVTGRTHQIRLHCAALGHPIVNDPLYLSGGDSRERPDSDRATLSMGLHAWKIELQHPLTNQRIEWTAPMSMTARQVTFPA